MPGLCRTIYSMIGCEQQLYAMQTPTRPNLPCRQAVLDALKPLGTLGSGIYGGDAIYLFARLPSGMHHRVPAYKVTCSRIDVIAGSQQASHAVGWPACCSCGRGKWLCSALCSIQCAHAVLHLGIDLNAGDVQYCLE